MTLDTDKLAEPFVLLLAEFDDKRLVLEKIVGVLFSVFEASALEFCGVVDAVLKAVLFKIPPVELGVVALTDCTEVLPVAGVADAPLKVENLVYITVDPGNIDVSIIGDTEAMPEDRRMIDSGGGFVGGVLILEETDSTSEAIEVELVVPEGDELLRAENEALRALLGKVRLEAVGAVEALLNNDAMELA